MYLFPLTCEQSNYSIIFFDLLLEPGLICIQKVAKYAIICTILLYLIKYVQKNKTPLLYQEY